MLQQRYTAFLLALVSGALAASGGFNTCWTYDCNTTDYGGLRRLSLLFFFSSSFSPTRSPNLSNVSTAPERWSECAPTCGGTMQSPINVELDNVHQTTSMRALTFSYTLGAAYARNEGSTIDVHVPGAAPLFPPTHPP